MDLLTNFAKETNTNIMSMHIASHSNTWNPHVKRLTCCGCSSIRKSVQATETSNNKRDKVFQTSQ